MGIFTLHRFKMLSPTPSARVPGFARVRPSQNSISINASITTVECSRKNNAGDRNNEKISAPGKAFGWVEVL